MTPADVAKQYFQDYEHRKLMRRRSEDHERRSPSMDGLGAAGTPSQRRASNKPPLAYPQSLSANHTPLGAGMGEEECAPLSHSNKAQAHHHSSVRNLEAEDGVFPSKLRSQASDNFRMDSGGSGLLDIPEGSLLSKLGVNNQANGHFKNLNNSMNGSAPRRSVDSPVHEARRQAGLSSLASESRRGNNVDPNPPASLMSGQSMSNLTEHKVIPNPTRRSVDSLVLASRRKGSPLNCGVGVEPRHGSIHQIEERMSVDSKGRFHPLNTSSSLESVGRSQHSASRIPDYAGNEAGPTVYARYEPCKPEAGPVSPKQASLAADVVAKKKTVPPAGPYAFTQLASFRVFIVVAIVVALLSIELLS